VLWRDCPRSRQERAADVSSYVIAALDDEAQAKQLMQLVEELANTSTDSAPR